MSFVPLLLLLFGLTILLSFLAAYALSRLVDEPSVRWSRQFGRWATRRFYRQPALGSSPI
jgi:peptidoglycan/LPS O-acetylase OafA/YrhL